MKIRKFYELFESYDLYTKSEFEKDCRSFFEKNAEVIIKFINESKNSTIILHRINDLVGGYGVEYLASEVYHGKYYQYNCCEFINMGDNMTVTILYDVNQKKFLVTSLEDFIQYYKEAYKII